jgi:ribosomal protein S4E
MPRSWKYTETGSGFVVTGGAGEGRMGVTALVQTSLGDHENVLKLDTSNGFTTLFKI